MLFQLLWPWIKEWACCSFRKKSDRICTVCKCLNVVFIPRKCKAVQNRILTEVRTAFDSNGRKLNSATSKLIDQSRGPIVSRTLGAKIKQPGLKKHEWSTTLCNSCMSLQKGDVCHRGWKAQLYIFSQAYTLAPFLLLLTVWANQTSKRQHQSHADFNHDYFWNCQNGKGIASPPCFSSA